MKAPSSIRSDSKDSNPHRLVCLAAAMFMAAHAAAAEPVTEGKYYACLSEQWLEDFTSSAVRRDYARITAYLASDKCLVLKPNLPVTVIDEPALPGTRIAFTIQGFRFYAPTEEILRK